MKLHAESLEEHEMEQEASNGLRSVSGYVNSQKGKGRDREPLHSLRFNIKGKSAVIGTIMSAAVTKYLKGLGGDRT